jgi:hypothetical protein
VLPDNRPPSRQTGQSQRRTFRQLFGLVKRNPFTISRWVLCWAVVGAVCGLFAGLYWTILELMLHRLEKISRLESIICYATCWFSNWFSHSLSRKSW